MNDRTDFATGTAGIAMSTADLVERLVDTGSIAARTAATRFRLVDDLRQAFAVESGATYVDPDELAWRDLRAEVAAALTIHERAAQTLLEHARRLVHDFPTTLSRLGAAEFSEAHARSIVDHSVGLSPHLFAEYERRLLDAASLLLWSRFDKFAREVRASLEPETLIERHREALADRRTAVEAAPDGMAWYGAYLSAEDAIGASSVVTGIARGLLVEGETRTLGQIEADVFRDLLVDAAGLTPSAGADAAPIASPVSGRGVRAEVLVHVPVLTAMGASDDAALLEGYGPIDAETARQLCAEAPGFVRVLTDPADGAVLSFGRTTYRPPAELKRYLRHRDEVCRFVGCTRNAKLCDIDHTIPWSEHGETVESNLAHLCRGHHRLKERSRWRAENSPGGTLTWTSPAGRTYTTHPARRGLRTTPMTEWLPPTLTQDTQPTF